MKFSIFVGGALKEPERCRLPLLPCTPLAPTSLLSLKPSQINSAVTLLEYHCRRNCWPPPEYHLYSTPDQDGNLLLLYKVFTRIGYTTRYCSADISHCLCVLMLCGSARTRQPLCVSVNVSADARHELLSLIFPLLFPELLLEMPSV